MSGFEATVEKWSRNYLSVMKENEHITLWVSSKSVTSSDISMVNSSSFWSTSMHSPQNIQWISLKLTCTTQRYLHFLKKSISVPIQGNRHGSISPMYSNIQLSDSFCYALFSKSHLGDIRRYERMSHKTGYDQTLLLSWGLLGTIHKVRQFEKWYFYPLLHISFFFHFLIQNPLSSHSLISGKL